MLARHARTANAPPASPMGIIEARQLVRELVNEWFDCLT
jgi:hypothetical protein